MTNSNPQSLRIAVQKSGRLTDKTIQLLKGIGLEFDDYKRSLLVRCLNFDVELLLIRDDDIPEYVQDGVCDLGFVGANERAEKKADVEVLKGLNYGVCRLSIATPDSSGLHTVEDLDGKSVATSYPNLTKDFFKNRGISVKTVYISGAVEIAPRLEVADAISDLVSTGNTLKANGLSEIATILESETQLVKTNRPLPDKKNDLIDKFMQRIDGYQLAKRSRYIMMNAPKTSIDRIKDIIPSLKSPTIMPLADETEVAIHSVIPIGKFWKVMEELKESGATDIVILPIESMIV